MKLVICGDVCTTHCEELIKNKETEKLFGKTLSIFKEADRALVNLECALTDKETPINKKGPNLKGHPVTAEILKEIGVTDCGISNNHIFDYGIPGVRDTQKLLSDAGINWTGFGENYEDSRKNLIINDNGKKICIIAVCEHEYCYALENRMGARPFDPFDTIEDVREAKKDSDFVIVTYHGGKEQSIYPSPRLVKASRAMVKAGADMVLCQHSHCIGCYEEFNGGHILYGQGNFHFLYPTRNHPHWQTGLMLKVDITDKMDVEFIPVRVNETGIDLATGEDYENIMKTFKEQSDNLHNGKWLEGWDQFCKESVERYIGNISKAYSENATPDDNEIFNGRMHCEAHKDVIDWLCKHSWEERKEP